MRQRSVRVSLVALLLLLLFVGNSYAQRVRPLENVLIETQKPYDKVIQAVKAQGGRITYEYQYVNGLAAEIPGEAFGVIRAVSGVTALYKDEEVPKPSSMNATRAPRSGTPGIATESSTPLNRLSTGELKKLAATSPGVYSINNAGTNIEKLHAQGFTGQGTTVAVIDSGIRIGFKSIQDSLIGGVDFVDDGAIGPAGDGQADWKQSSNDGHGTFVAGLIAGNGVFTVNRVLKQALLQYAPSALVGDTFSLIGTAPDAKIYVVRVFGDDASTGARLGTILSAIEHVTAQRQLYETSGGKQGIKIDVANLSLGLSTLAAGRTLLDTSIDGMLAVGIVPVISVGDVGPSALTTSSPGSSMSAVTVGASSSATNERILNEVQYGTQFAKEYYPGIGADIRPFSGTEVVWFSSRGPNADGRLDPDVVANGLGNISQGYCPDQILEACFKKLSFGSGSSFSAPIVSGIAAALVQAFPDATATQIRNAIIASGQVNAIAPYFDVLDRGQGLVNAEAAYTLLDGGGVPNILPPTPPLYNLVRDNIENNTGFDVKSGLVSQSFTAMKPGQRAEILYDVPLLADYVRVRIRKVSMHDPQNVFFGGDRLFVYVHSAKTSSIGARGDYRVNGEELHHGGEAEFIVKNPDTGVMRITLNPDTLNAGTVDADVEIDTILLSPGPPTTTISNTVTNGEIKLFTEHVNAGTAELSFFLHWDHDWAHYPTSDVDVVVCEPTIPSSIADCRLLGNKKGATLAAPERVVIPNPAAGDWTVLVHGFNVPLDLTENFTLEIRH